MTLEGLSVEEWMSVQETDPAPRPTVTSDAAQDGPEAARKPRVARVRPAITWLVALGLGAWLALPALNVSASCPPPGEGAIYCHLQHNVLQAVMTLFLVTAAVVIAERTVRALPAFARRVRSEGLFPRPPSAAVYGDPLLVAANRGHIV